MSHICMYPLTRLIFYLVQMFFVFNLLNFRYFNEKLTGEKGIKEPNTGGMAQEEKPAGRERREEKKNCCSSSWFFQFKNAMPSKVFFKCFTLWYLFLLNWGLFINNSSIGTQQFHNHTSRVYSTFYIFNAKTPKIEFFLYLTKNLNFFFFSGETLFMCRFRTLASAWKCPEMP